MEGTGEITCAGGSLIFLRGMLTCGGRKVFAFSGTIKGAKLRMPTAIERTAMRRCNAQLYSIT